MGLDIYAGTLTRYYSHNWKTVVQQWAEENGYSFNRITPDGEPADDEELSPTNVQAAVENWRDQILAAISQPDQPPYAPWPENNEKPYYTDKPDWDAFGAMLLVAACRTYEEPVPPTVEKDWDFGEHPLIARLASDEERVWSLLRGATWWLPLTDILKACWKLIQPRASPPALPMGTSQCWPESKINSSGVTLPSSNAAVPVMILNVDPGGYSPDITLFPIG